MRTKLPAGHGWAYLGVILGLGASVAGNVSNTVLMDSDVDLRLRIPFAILWPTFLGIGIEVLTRIEWERNWRTWIARALLVGPVSALSAFMSYLHLHHLMILSGEPGLAQAVGPLAIDGTLFGCTVALLVTRGRGRHQVAAPRQTLAGRVAAMRSSVVEVVDAAKNGVPAASPAPVLPVPMSPVPMSPARVPVRRSSAGSWDTDKAVKLVLDGVQSNEDIAGVLGTSAKTIQRVRRAATLLLGDHTAAVPTAWKVSPDVVDLIRSEVSR